MSPEVAEAQGWGPRQWWQGCELGSNRPSPHRQGYGGLFIFRRGPPKLGYVLAEGRRACTVMQSLYQRTVVCRYHTTEAEPQAHRTQAKPSRAARDKAKTQALSVLRVSILGLQSEERGGEKAGNQAV